MDLGLTGEQDALQRSVRSLCEDRFPTAAARSCEDNPAVLPTIYDDLYALGLGGILIAEQAGGLGLGMTDMVIVQSELGRALVPMLFSESAVLAASALGRSDSDAAKDLLAALATGEKRAVCAWQNSDRSAPGGTQSARIEVTPDGTFTLDGDKSFVADTAFADSILVLASDDRGDAALCLVDSAAAGITASALPNMADLSLANLHFSEVPVVAVAARGDAARAAWDRALTAMKIAIAAQAVGGAQQALDMAREYASTRQQFGQPIGSFQSIAHYLADAAVNVEGARMLVYRAAAAYDDGDPVATWTDMAKMKACQVYRDTSALSIQIHGGIGFTLEADPQLYFRRAKHLQLMYGDPLDLQERTGAALIAGTHKVLEA